jgi:four helix bundle protein
VLTFNRVKQKTRELCQAVSKLINKARFQKDSSLKEQIWKAAGSAMDNVAEGFDEKEFRN